MPGIALPMPCVISEQIWSNLTTTICLFPGWNYLVRVNHIRSSLPTSLYTLTLGNLCGQNQSFSVESAHITISSNTGESMWSESIIFGRVCPHHFILEHWGIYVVRINHIWSSLPTSLYPRTLGNLCGQNQLYSVESAHITICSQKLLISVTVFTLFL